MAGLARICKALGSMTVNGLRYVWDYTVDAPVPESEMPIGSEQWKASEEARWKAEPVGPGE